MQVLKAAFKAFEMMKEEDRRGRKPMYRKREWKRNERRREKIRKSKNWNKKGGKESVLFVTATPESELKNKLQKEIEKSTFKIKVVEKSGIKVRGCCKRTTHLRKAIVERMTACYAEGMAKDHAEKTNYIQD